MKIGDYFEKYPEPQDEPHSTTVTTVLEKQPEGGMALLDPRSRQKVELFASEIRDITRRVTLEPIKSAEEAHQVGELLARAKIAAKELDACRRAAVDPFNEKVKLINKSFKPMTEALDHLEARGKKLTLAWLQQEAARVRREQDAALKAQEEAALREAEATEKGDLVAAEAASQDQTSALLAAPAVALRALRGDSGTTSLRKVWRFEVVNPVLVPREYLDVDQDRIRKAVAAGAREIAGVNIFEAEELATRVG